MVTISSRHDALVEMHRPVLDISRRLLRPVSSVSSTRLAVRPHRDDASPLYIQYPTILQYFFPCSSFIRCRPAPMLGQIRMDHAIGVRTAWATSLLWTLYLFFWLVAYPLMVAMLGTCKLTWCISRSPFFFFVSFLQVTGWQIPFLDAELEGL